MANNNDSIYNAALLGAVAGQETWINSNLAASYAAFNAVVVKVAQAVDAQIAPTAISSCQATLMQSMPVLPHHRTIPMTASRCFIVHRME